MFKAIFLLLTIFVSFNVYTYPVIKKIEFKGLETLQKSERHILSYLKSKEGGPFFNNYIREDIKLLFEKNLFKDIEVFCVDLNGDSCSEDSSEVVLTYNLKENPTIDSVTISGNDEVEIADIEGVVDVQPNTILNVAKIQGNVQKILDLYKGKGLFLADVTFEIEQKEGNYVKVKFKINENAKTIIRKIRFIGNLSIPASEIKKVMLTKEGGFFSEISDSGIFKEEDFERDIAVIKLYYQENGFLKATVSEPEILLSKNKKEMDITIYVQEGDKYSFGSFDVSGDLLFSKEEILEPFNSLSGKEFKRSDIASAIERVNIMYKNKGYADVTVSTPLKINESTKIIDIPLVIQKGKISYIERIDFEGNTITRDKVLRRELRLYEGDLYNQSKLDYSKARVFSLGYFEAVEFQIKEGSREGRKRVVFQVKEKSTGTFQVGMGFSTVEKLVFTAQISKNNIFGNGQSVSLSAQLSKLQKYYSVSFSDPYLFDTLWDFTFSIYNTNILYNYFTKKTFGSSVTIGHPITDFLRFYLKLKGEEVEVEKGGGISGASDIPSIYGLFKDGRTVSLDGMLVYDRRNNRMFPTKGFYQSLSVENASYLSENKFTKISSDTRVYIPLFWSFVYRFNARVGWIPDSKNVPIFERYYVGGIFSVRGFEWGSLSPSKEQIGSPFSSLTEFQVGGNKQLIINNEIEFDLVKAANIKGVFFIDSGNAFIEEDPISFSALRSSWGFGFRWLSPMGPLRFEWGFPFDPKPTERSYMFEFNIGNSF